MIPIHYDNGSFLVLGFDKIPLYGVFVLTFGGALVFALIVRLVFVPWLKKKILLEVSDAEEPIVTFCHVRDDEEKSGDQQKKTVESNGKKKECEKFETVINFQEDSGTIRYIQWIFFVFVCTLGQGCREDSEALGQKT